MNTIVMGSLNYHANNTINAFLQLESDEEIAAAVVNITAEASTLESSALTVSGNIIQDLTDAAIEQPEVSISAQYDVSGVQTHISDLGS